jgi:hypothetical protein
MSRIHKLFWIAHRHCFTVAAAHVTDALSRTNAGHESAVSGVRERISKECGIEMRYPEAAHWWPMGVRPVRRTSETWDLVAQAQMEHDKRAVATLEVDRCFVDVPTGSPEPLFS